MNHKYPWESWLGRTRAFTLHRGKGKDFQCASYIMAQQIRNRVSRLGRSAEIDIQEKLLKVKIYD